MAYASHSYDPHGGLLDDEDEAEGHYLLRHWRGQLSLSRSYWVNGFAVNVIINIAVAMLAALTESHVLRAVAIAFLAFVALSLVLRTWSLVGIWRSAGRHVQRGGQAVWAFAARAVIVLFLLTIALGLPKLWAIGKDMALISIGHDPIGAPVEVTLARDGTTLTVAGNIGTGSAAALEAALRKAPAANTIELQSNGGRILEALAMADQIRDRKLNTHVERNCQSACTLLLLAGAQRSADPLAHIGFHQPAFPGMSQSDRETIIQQNSTDYRTAGMDDAFIQRIMATPPDQMWFPAYQEMVEARVLSDSPIIIGGDRNTHRGLEASLQRFADEVNQSKGRMIDQVTRMDGASLDGTELTIRYRITRQPPAAARRQMSENLRKRVVEQICGGSLGTVFSQGAAYRMIYSLPDGGEFAAIDVRRCA